MTDDAQMKIRLPRALKEKIERSSEEKNRTLNGEIVSRLEESFNSELTLIRALDIDSRFKGIEARLKLVEGRLIADEELDTEEISGNRISGSARLLMDAKKLLHEED